MKKSFQIGLCLLLLLCMLGVSACSGTVTETTAGASSEATTTATVTTPTGPSYDPSTYLTSYERKAIGAKQGAYYEIFVRAFADSNNDGIGDLRGLIQKLDYLNDGDDATTEDLGITGIWLMPINPTSSYHGYDVTDYRDINPEYGTLADFEELLTEAHKRGISVIMDLVVNHTGIEHPWFEASKDPKSPYRNWYIWADESDTTHNLDISVWGHKVWNKIGSAYYYALFYSGMPDLNYSNPEVRTEIKDVAKFWLDKGVDGFRLDAVPHIYGTGELPNNLPGSEETIAWWKEFQTYCESVKPDVFIVGEVLDRIAVRLPYLSALNSVFHVDMGEAITAAIRAGGSKNDYIAQLFEREYQQIANANPNYLDCPFLSNHDQNRIIGFLMGKIPQMKLAASMYLTTEGLPFVYYGEEIGMFGSKPDEDIRLPFVWGDDPLQTTWRTSKYGKVVSQQEQEMDENSLFTHYKRLIRVRTANEALYAGKYKALLLKTDGVAGWTMTSENQEAIVLHNLSAKPVSVSYDLTRYVTTFVQTREGFEMTENQVTLPAESTVILVRDR